MPHHFRAYYLVGSQKIHRLIQIGMRIGLAHQDEMEFLAFQRQTKRLPAEQIVPQDGYPSFRVELSLFF